MLKSLEPADRVLVVGGTGFIGRHLIRRCLAETPHIMVLAFRSGSPSARLPGATMKFCDIRDREAVGRVLAGLSFEYVFNLAGYIDHSPYFAGGRDVVDQHLVGLMNLLNSIDRSTLKRFIQVGTSEEYGDAAAPQKESQESQAISPYAFAKSACTRLLTLVGRTEGLPASVARLFLVYGPGQDQRRFLPQIISACLKGEQFPVTAGEQLRDFCYVDDVVDGLLRVASAERTKNEIVNVASGVPMTVRRMVERVMELVGQGVAQFGARPYRAGESMALVADVSKVRELAGWAPTTDLTVGLRQTITALQEQLAECRS